MRKPADLLEEHTKNPDTGNYMVMRYHALPAIEAALAEGRRAGLEEAAEIAEDHQCSSYAGGCLGAYSSGALCDSLIAKEIRYLLEKKGRP